MRFVFILVSTQSLHAPSQNSEPVPPHPGICLRTSQFRRERASRSHPGTTTETVRGNLFWLSSTSVRLRPVSHAAAVRVHRILGLCGFSRVSHATGQLQTMRSAGRRSAVGYGETRRDPNQPRQIHLAESPRALDAPSIGQRQRENALRLLWSHFQFHLHQSCNSSLCRRFSTGPLPVVIECGRRDAFPLAVLLTRQSAFFVPL